MDLVKIKDYIHNRHIPMTALAKELDISKQSLYLKLNGERDFRSDEMTKMADVLRMTKDEILDIFFDK